MWSVGKGLNRTKGVRLGRVLLGGVGFYLDVGSRLRVLLVRVGFFLDVGGRIRVWLG